LQEPPPDLVCDPTLDYIVVVDDSRQKGLTSRVVEACRERWPDIELSLPNSEVGEALYRKF